MWAGLHLQSHGGRTPRNCLGIQRSKTGASVARNLEACWSPSHLQKVRKSPGALPHPSILYYTRLHHTILHYTTLHYTMLYYTMLYYAILYYTILYYTILYYTILYYTILYYTILYYTILYYTILYYTVLYYTILYYTILYYTILYYTILYYTILYYTILYYTILYYTILYYTILYYTILHQMPAEGKGEGLNPCAPTCEAQGPNPESCSIQPSMGEGLTSIAQASAQRAQYGLIEKYGINHTKILIWFTSCIPELNISGSLGTRSCQEH